MFDAHLHSVEMQTLPAHLSGAIVCAVRPAEWAQLPEDASVPLTPAFGIHPWFAGACTDETPARLREHLLRHPGACIGEIGLDACRDETHQLRALTAQLELAAELRRPVILHCVRAWGKLFDTLRPWRDEIPGWMIHGVNCAPELLTHPFCKAETLFFSVGSFGRPLTAKRAALLRALPADRLLIESDAPDGLLPGRTHAETLRDTLVRLAALREIAPETLEEATAANARRFLSTRQL